MIRHMAIGGLALAIMACRGAPLPPADGDPAAQAAPALSPAVFRDDIGAGWRDPVTIASAEVAGDTLRLAVRYGGGCAPHRFQLQVSPAFRESYPVQAGARLAHDAAGDACKALIHLDLRFDLRPIRDAYRAAYQTQRGEVVLSLEGYSGGVVYRFQ